MVCCRDQVECLLLAFQRGPDVRLQPVKQSTKVLVKEEQHFLGVKILAQVFD